MKKTQKLCLGSKKSLLAPRLKLMPRAWHSIQMIEPSVIPLSYSGTPDHYRRVEPQSFKPKELQKLHVRFNNLCFLKKPFIKDTRNKIYKLTEKIWN